MTKPAEDSLAEARRRIVFPLDFPTPAEAESFADRLGGRVGIFKVGLELFIAAGPSVLRTLPSDTGIFLDLKLHDIPATVGRAARAAAGQGVRFLSVHTSGGGKMLESAVEGAGEGTKILAITVLTSLDGQELKRLGLREDLTDPSALVLHRAALARETGCAGIVCSGREVGAVKERFGAEFIALVPGVRPDWGEVSGDDQARVSTPAEAVRRGADYLVVGRPIRLAGDPASAADRIAGEIASVRPDGAALS